MNDLEQFLTLAAALEPWRKQVVFVGGWAHRLHRQHPLAVSPSYQPLATKDADVAFADDEKMDGSIKDALVARGFTENLSGNHRPPVSSYTLGDEASGFYAEFLTPLKGSGRKRNGEKDATLLKADITAQKLRHLEILLFDTWQITLPAEQDGAAGGTIVLRAPNPVSFIAQKVLIRDDRLPDKRAQDVLYIHDTLELFSAQLPVLADLWKQRLAPALTDRQRRDALDGLQAMFATVTDTLRDAARIPQDRSLVPERMQAFGAAAIAQLLG